MGLGEEWLEMGMVEEKEKGHQHLLAPSPSPSPTLPDSFRGRESAKAFRACGCCAVPQK